MDKIVYVCTGGCGAVIPEEKYNEGLKQCGAESCPHKGHEFEKRMRCAKCNKIYSEAEGHQC